MLNESLGLDYYLVLYGKPVSGDMARMKHPDIKSELLGRLRFHETLSVYEGEIIYEGEQVDLFFERNEQTDVEENVAKIERCVSNLKDHVEKAREFAVQELLKLKNSEWRWDDDPILTAAEFKAQMPLTNIAVSIEGDIELSFYDGELFSDHAVKVAFDKQMECRFAGIE